MSETPNPTPNPPKEYRTVTDDLREATPPNAQGESSGGAVPCKVCNGTGLDPFANDPIISNALAEFHARLAPTPPPCAAQEGPTPITDSAKVDAGWIIASHSTGEFVPAETAANLERLLAESRTECERLRLQIVGCDQIIQGAKTDMDALRDECQQLKADKERLRTAMIGAVKDLRPLYDYLTMVNQDRASSVSEIRDRLSAAIAAATTEGQV